MKTQRILSLFILFFDEEGSKVAAATLANFREPYIRKTQKKSRPLYGTGFLLLSPQISLLHADLARLLILYLG